jgi:large subunit ribosomal protein L33
MASKTKKIIKLKSTESPHFYTIYKNVKKAGKMELKKYDPTLRRHVTYKEEKIS